MSIGAIRDGIAKNLGAIANLRIAPTIPDNPNPPIVVISLNKVAYNQSMKSSSQLVEYTFTLTAIISRVTERTAQDRLDAFCAATGDMSIKAAVEADRTLDGSAFDCLVTEMSAYGQVTLGDVDYLSAEFSLTVYAN
jgi:hypothetical protein